MAWGHLLARLGRTPAAPALRGPPGSPCSGASVFWVSMNLNFLCLLEPQQLLPAWEEGSAAWRSLMHILCQCEPCDLSRVSLFHHQYRRRLTPRLHPLYRAFRDPRGEFRARTVTPVWKVCIHPADRFAFVS